MKLFVVRHGETDGNVKELACGISESTLTEKGRMQAQALANQLNEDREKNNITTIYVSPLKRARDTAVYIERVLQLTAIPEARLKEINFGDFEEKPWNNPEFLYIHKNPFLKFPGERVLCTGRTSGVQHDRRGKTRAYFKWERPVCLSRHTHRRHLYLF